MAFKIYVSDRINSAELDTEELDVKSIYALLDITDIGNKRANIQTLTLKGTKNNNNVFGYFFNIERLTDYSQDNRLFFNYNPQRSVDVFVFEDTELIFNGELRINEVIVDVDGNIQYNCIISTSLTLLKQAFQNKLMTDLDFSQWIHYSCYETIRRFYEDKETIRSQNNVPYTASTEFYNDRRGYVYAMIDYGYRESGTTQSISGYTPTLAQTFSINNFKPGLWLNEVMQTIFEQSDYLISGGLSPRFNLRASTEFTEKFNNLFLPDTNDEQFEKVPGCTTIFDFSGNCINRSIRYIDYRGIGQDLCNQVCSGPQDEECYIPSLFSRYYAKVYVPIDIITFSTGCTYSLNEFYTQSDLEGGQYYSITINREINTSINLNFSLITSMLTPGGGGPADLVQVNTSTFFRVALIKQSGALDPSQIYSATESILAFVDYYIPYGSFITDTVDFYVENVTFNRGDKLRIALIYGNFLNVQTFTLTNNPNPCDGFYNFVGTDITHFWQICNMELKLPGKNTDTFNYVTRPVFNCNDAVLTTPKIMSGIKVIDFLKSIIQLFNFVVYYDKNDPKNLIFTPYSEYYALTRLPNLLTNSIDWTNKVDYTTNINIKSNIDLPKNYLFTYKLDSDFLNKKYNDKFKEIYGQLEFDDDYGISDQKKIELIFSPSPMASVDNYFLPLYYKAENNTINTMKINPRILYYNGYYDFFNAPANKYISFSTGSTVFIIQQLVKYPQCSNFLIIPQLEISGTTTGLTVTNDIHFNDPIEYYYDNINGFFTNVPNSYSLYYIDQISDITNQDVIYIECDALLNPLDITNLDLSVPIYIQTGTMGGAYFRVLEVEYENKNTPSRVKLQKIIV